MYHSIYRRPCRVEYEEMSPCRRQKDDIEACRRPKWAGSGRIRRRDQSRQDQRRISNSQSQNWERPSSAAPASRPSWPQPEHPIPEARQWESGIESWTSSQRWWGIATLRRLWSTRGRWAAWASCPDRIDAPINMLTTCKCIYEGVNVQHVRVKKDQSKQFN